LERLEQRQLLAANFDSAFAFGGVFDDVGTGLSMDAAGDNYLTGYFSGTTDLDPGAGTFNVSTASDPATNARPYGSFVAKYDSAGNLVWGTQLLPKTDSVFSWDVTITPSGNSFAGGYIEAEPSRNESLFVSKLDSSGNLAWTVRADGGRVMSVGADASGNVYATGQFYGAVDIDGDGNLDLQDQAGSVTPFIFKLDGDGKLLWAHSFAGTNGNTFTQLAVNPKGDVYATGFFNNTADFDPGPGVFDLTADHGGAFVLKLDKDGIFQWARSFNGGSGFTVAGSDIDVDAAGNVVSTGLFGGTVDFDPGSGTRNISAGGPADQPLSNVYISKLDSAGNFVWAARAAESADIQSSQPQISLDGRGNVLVGATFSGRADFDQRPGGCTEILTGSDDMFLLKLNSAGQYLWAEQISSDQRVTPRDIAANSAGRIAVGGDFQGTTDFDPGPATHNISSATANFPDGFLLRLREQSGAPASPGHAKPLGLPSGTRKTNHHKSPAQKLRSLKETVKRLKAQIKAGNAEGDDVSDRQSRLKAAVAALKKATKNHL
jgi:hypothetical protein